MQINSLKSAHGSRAKKVRVGRGIGSTKGKTAGRGHKGQHARAGGFHKVGFEGGQMPLQRRLPKVGFRSKVKIVSASIGLSVLNSLSLEEISVAALVDCGVLKRTVKRVKIYLNAEANRPMRLKGIAVTEAVRTSVTGVGGTVSAA